MENEILENTQVNDTLTEGVENDGVEQTTEEQVEQEQPKPEQPVEKTFTQEQVNKILQSRLERRSNSLFNRYGVKDRDGLDGLIGKAQSYDIMKERLNNVREENYQLKEKLAFMSNGISPDREDDVRAHFKGKGLEFSNETLVTELATHPEWRAVVNVDNTPKTTIRALGVEHKNKEIQETPAEKMHRIYGI